MMGSQSEERMNDTLQKASLISEQKQTWSRPNSSLILRHTVQSPASMPLPSAQVRSLLLCPLGQRCQEGSASVKMGVSGAASLGWVMHCQCVILVQGMW